jgi:ribonuclease HI
VEGRSLAVVDDTRSADLAESAEPGESADVFQTYDFASETDRQIDFGILSGGSCSNTCKIVEEAVPKNTMDDEQKEAINKWRPGMELPGVTEKLDEEEEEEEDVDEEDEAMEREGEKYICLVCSEEFTAPNALQYHYDAEHSIRDPDVVTVIVKKCNECKGCFARADQLKTHLCPAVHRRKVRESLQTGGWFPVYEGPALPPPEGWLVSTDRSGQIEGSGANKKEVAGWGVAIFRMPLRGDVPDFVLHGPVVTQEWDHLWMGARAKTNNTGELQAIGEAMLWLTDEAPDDGDVPVLFRYDSEYAAGMAQRRYEPKSNEELAARVAELTENVMERRVVTWEHVYGHTGALDNEIADRAADSGAQGRISKWSRRWAAPPPVTPAQTVAAAAKGKAKSKSKAKAKPKR